MNVDDQLSIVRSMQMNNKELQDITASQMNWEKEMKNEDLKRKAVLKSAEDKAASSSKAKSGKHGGKKQSPYEKLKLAGTECYKSGAYAKAIEWYNRAMTETSTAAEVCVLYANRAQCHNVLKEFQEAVNTCERALKLNDKLDDANRLNETHQKVMFRLMVAQQGLNNFKEALATGHKLLSLYPTNRPAVKCIAELEQQIAQLPVPIKRAYESTLDGQGDDVWFIEKPPHLQSREVLTSIPIVSDAKSEASSVVSVSVPEEIHMKIEEIVSESPKAIIKVEEKVDVSLKPIADEPKHAIDMSFLDSVNREPTKQLISSQSTASFKKNTKELQNFSRKSDHVIPAVPTSAAEFQRHWLNLRSSSERYEYLKLIPSCNFSVLLGSQLTSDLFSELLVILSTEFIHQRANPMEYLIEIAKCPELSIIAMMKNADDRKALDAIISYTTRRHEELLQKINDAYIL